MDDTYSLKEQYRKEQDVKMCSYCLHHYMRIDLKELDNGLFICAECEEEESKAEET